MGGCCSTSKNYGIDSDGELVDDEGPQLVGENSPELHRKNGATPKLCKVEHRRNSVSSISSTTPLAPNDANEIDDHIADKIMSDAGTIITQKIENTAENDDVDKIKCADSAIADCAKNPIVLTDDGVIDDNAVLIETEKASDNLLFCPNNENSQPNFGEASDVLNEEASETNNITDDIPNSSSITSSSDSIRSSSSSADESCQPEYGKVFDENIRLNVTSSCSDNVEKIFASEPNNIKHDVTNSSSSSSNLIHSSSSSSAGENGQPECGVTSNVLNQSVYSTNVDEMFASEANNITDDIPNSSRSSNSSIISSDSICSSSAQESCQVECADTSDRQSIDVGESPSSINEKEALTHESNNVTEDVSNSFNSSDSSSVSEADETVLMLNNETCRQNESSLVKDENIRDCCTPLPTDQTNDRPPSNSSERFSPEPICSSSSESVHFE